MNMRFRNHAALPHFFRGPRAQGHRPIAARLLFNDTQCSRKITCARSTQAALPAIVLPAAGDRKKWTVREPAAVGYRWKNHPACAIGTMFVAGCGDELRSCGACTQTAIAQQ